MANNKRPRVILPHTAVADKPPIITDVLPGEIYVNGANGDGKAFFITKKTDDTLATFHEDEFQSGITSNLETRISTLENNMGDIASILDDVLYNF